MAWGLDQSRTTWTLADIARPIPKWALQTGDVLINNASVEQAHVVIFDKWANKEHTAYWEFEQCGSVGKTAHRVVPYPFWTSDRASYVPYRFAGGVKQYVRKPKPRPKAVRTVATVLSSIQATNAKAATAVPVASKTPSAKKPAATKPAARPTAKNAHARTAASRTVPASAAPPPIRKAAPRRAGWIPVGRNSGSDVLRDPVVVTLIRDLVAWIAR
jgi:hypothetical protein